MKLQIASDIHREFGHNPEIPDAGGDVLVLAADIGHADEETVEWIRNDLAGRFGEILYVPGNHEFYGSYLREAAAYMDRKAAHGGYTWLNNRAIEVGGQRFVGTPLWANFCGDPLSMLEAGRSISDFDQIWFGEGRRLTPEIMLTLHKEAKAFLEATVRPGDIVITHWPPTLEARRRTGHRRPRRREQSCSPMTGAWPKTSNRPPSADPFVASDSKGAETPRLESLKSPLSASQDN